MIFVFTLQLIKFEVEKLLDDLNKSSTFKSFFFTKILKRLKFFLQMAKSFLSLLSDYIVFIIIVIITTVVPLWSRFFGKKKTRTKADYVFAAGSVSVVSMMLSIARGTLGVRSFLGEKKK